MKARHLIGGDAFPPDVMKIVVKAFDDAWAEVEPSVTDTFDAIEAARLSLVNIVVNLAKDDANDPEELKSQALLNFRLKRPFAN